MLSDCYPRMYEIFGAYFNQDYDIWGNTIEEIALCYIRDSPREYRAELIDEINSFMHEHPKDLDSAFEINYGMGFDPKLWGYTVESFLDELILLIREHSTIQYQNGTEKISIMITHHIDASDPDENGMYDYYYEYDIHEFIDGRLSYIVRSYVDEPENAHFLKMKSEDEKDWRIIEKEDMDAVLFRNAIAYLKEKGKIHIQYLSSGPECYIDI